VATPLKPELVVVSPFHTKCSLHSVCKWEFILDKRPKRTVAQLKRKHENEFAKHLTFFHKQ
jgi:hypothetical protein